MKHIFITIPFIAVIIISGVIALSFCVVFTVISWCFEMATDWLYKITDMLWMKYEELEKQNKNK